MNTMESFRLDGKACVITGGAGMLGAMHAEAVIETGGTAVLLDISEEALEKAKKRLSDKYGPLENKCHCVVADITDELSLRNAFSDIIYATGQVDALVNNAAIDPKTTAMAIDPLLTRLEYFSANDWTYELDVGLKGAFLCCKIFGSYMANNHQGVILNVASDLGLIGPDQRIYRKDGVPEDDQPTKPVTYSVIKHGLIGLTRYVATYWAANGVRCNAICPGGVYAQQDAAFVSKLENLIPLGRMARIDEYKPLVAFMLSPASSYMTGAVVAADGGRTCW
jgi:NAD(P)-dependent dehydrogenase (short-subunit alcohol dehydrogenase family)